LDEGYPVRTASSGRAALASLSEWQPQLVTTDLEMAPMTGIDLCRQIRETSDVPIIVVSGEDRLRSKVEALDSGADDYVLKPFEPSELLARARAVLRRRRSTETSGSLHAGEFRIDVGARRVYVGTNEVRLTPKEFEVFVYLV